MDEILFSSFFALVFEFHLLSKKFLKNEFYSTYLDSIYIYIEEFVRIPSSRDSYSK